MSLLLDTHAVIWWATDPGKLPLSTYQRIDAEPQVLVSAVSAYEMTFKLALGKLPVVARLLIDLPGYLAAQSFEPLPVTLAHAETAGRLPLHHRDPFDRLLIAQALVDDLTLVSNEALFDRYGVRRLW